MKDAHPVQRIARPPSRRLLILFMPLSLLALVLSGGCASRAYPPLPEMAPVEGPTSSARSSGTVGSALALDAFLESSPADGRAERPPAISQDVIPPPPDPDVLPDASTRRLDIRLASQRFNYFEDDQLIWSGPISSGTPEHPTPEGDYRVQQKDINKRSGSYTNYFEQPTPMPYALQITGPYWVHEGYVTGQPESHGCVRLRHEDAKFVYGRIKVGDRILIAD